MRLRLVAHLPGVPQLVEGEHLSHHLMIMKYTR